jgi:hypothetical protein
MAEHSFGETGFWCIKCGCSRSDADQSEIYWECLAAENVVAISHIVRDRGLLAAAPVKRLRALHAGDQPASK